MKYNERPLSSIREGDRSEVHVYTGIYNHGKLELSDKVALRKASEWRSNVKPMTKECDPLKAGKPMDLDELFDLWRAQRLASNNNGAM